MIPSFETVTSERFFKQKVFLFDKFNEFNSSLRVSLFSSAFELFRTKTESALVKTSTNLNHMLKNVFCKSNSVSEPCKPNLKDHLAAISYSKFIKIISFSSIMHLFCPMSVEKGAGAMEKHTYLGVGDTLNIVAIKGKPPDLQELRTICRESKQLKTSHFGIWNWKYLRKTTSIIQGCFNLKCYFDNYSMTIWLIILFVPKLFPFDVGDLVFLQLESTNQEYEIIKASSSMLKDEPPDAIHKKGLSHSRFRSKRYPKENLILQEHMLTLSELPLCAKDEPLELEVLPSNVFVRTRVGVILIQDKKTIADFRMIFEVGEKKLMQLRKKKIPFERESKQFNSPFNLKGQIYEPELPKVSIFVFNNHFTFNHTDMIRLSLPKGSNAGFGACFKRPRRATKREEDKRFKPPDLDKDIYQYINNFLLMKEPRPDATYKSKIKPRIANHVKKINDSKTDLQGKYNESASFNVTDLIPYCADEPDLRSNPFQEGGDDVIMDSSRTKEAKEKEEQLESESEEEDKQLEPEDNQEEEEVLDFTNGPMTRARTKKFHQAFTLLLHTIQGSLVSLDPTTLVVIQAT